MFNRSLLDRVTLVAALLLPVLGSSTIKAAGEVESISPDGSWWQGLPQDSKEYVVQGMVGAYEAAWSIGTARVFVRAHNVLIRPNVIHSISITDYDTMEHAIHSDPVSFSKTFETYVHRIDDYYINNPDRMHMLVGALLDCLVDDSPHPCD